MEGDQNAVLERLGATLRSKRKALGMTLVEVSASAGLSAGFLSQAERGLVAPSLSSLRGLARALDLPLSWLLAQPDGSVPITRQNERVGYGPDLRAFRYERISARFPGHVLNSVLVHESPGHRSEPIRHEGEELFFILSGELTVELEGTVHLLRTGDSLHFSSDALHSSWNHTSTETVILHVCTMDIFEDGRSPAHEYIRDEGTDQMTTEPQTTFAALHDAIDRALGARLFTVSVIDTDRQIAWRAYTSDATAYPLTGEKPILRDAWTDLVIGAKQTFVANTTAEFEPYFPDHAFINELGCESAMNIPVLSDGKVIGTVNILDKANHFDPARATAAKRLVRERETDLAHAIEGLTKA